jgi:hypothetical protein
LGSGNTDVGNQGQIRKPGQPISSELRIEAPNTARRPAISGAMSQQCGDSGNFSTPQKFVQLVGCRDPKARPETWVRPGAAKR